MGPPWEWPPVFAFRYISMVNRANRANIICDLISNGSLSLPPRRVGQGNEKGRMCMCSNASRRVRLVRVGILSDAHDNARHGWIIVGEKRGKAWVTERLKCRGDQVNKSRGNQHARSKMFAEEYNSIGEFCPADSFPHDRETSSGDTECEDQEDRTDMERKVVLGELSSSSATLWFRHSCNTKYKNNPLEEPVPEHK